MTMRRLLRALATTVIAIGLAGITASASHAAAPTPTDLSTLGGTYSAAYGVNNSGQVVGQSSTASDAETHAFLWDPVGGMVDLGTLGGVESGATGINDAGQVVGSSTTAGLEKHAFLWDPVGGMVDLGTLGGVESGATGINDAGQVVGYSQNADHSLSAFLWDPVNGMVDLGNSEGGGSWASGINDAGQVVGSRNSPWAPERTAWVWDPVGGRADLGAFDGGSDSEIALGINDAGQVVGYSYTGPDEGYDAHAFVWDPVGGIVALDLGDLGGGTSRANGINDAGQVVGYLNSPSGTPAFLWDPVGGMVGLDLGVWANGINDAGQIVGVGASMSGGGYVFHAVLWDMAAPVDADTVGFTVTGGISYTNSAALTGGDLAVAGDSRGVTSVTGTATFASAVSGSAEATFNVRRFWILPAYTGTVRVNDPAAGVALNHTVFFSRVNPDGTEGATNTQGWFDLSHWPWRTYSLTWTVQDIA